MRVGQRRSEACVVLESLTSCGFLTFVLKYRPVWRQHGAAAREPDGPDAKHPVQSNNGAPTLGGHFDKEADPTLHTHTHKKPPSDSFYFCGFRFQCCQKNQRGRFSSLDVVSERNMVRKICGALQSFLVPNSFLPALLVRSLLDPPEFLHYPSSNALPRPYTARTVRRKQH